MMWTWMGRTAAAAVWTALVLPAADVHDQFAAWGTRGPELADVPAGWSRFVEKTPAPAAPRSDADSIRHGFLLAVRRPFADGPLVAAPGAQDREVVLQAFAALGCYEPLTFSLTALEDLLAVHVSCAGCSDGTGARIASDDFDVRWVRPVRCPLMASNPDDKRYREVPFYLEKRDQFVVAKDATAQVWLTVKIPVDARPGLYSGMVEVQAAGRPAAAIPLQLRVLPFHLPPVPIETTISYPRAAKDPQTREKQLIDQREHGISSVEVGVAAVIASRDRHFGADDIAATEQAGREALALRRKVFGPGERWPITAEIGNQVLYEWNGQKHWFEFWPHAPALEEDLFTAIRTIRTIATAQTTQPLRLFILDEPGGHPDLFKEAIYYNTLVKSRMPELQTFATIGGGIALGIDEIGLLGGCIDFLSINRFSPSICQRLLARHKPFGVYNGGGATEEVTGLSRDRYFFGFYGWKTGAAEILQWAYDCGDPWTNPLRGNDGYSYLAADGPLPSIPWEGVRAGIDDYRYLDLLWRLVTVARASGDAQAVGAAERAEAVGRRIMGQIDFAYQPASGAGSPAPPAALLERFRWQVAEACLDLLRMVPLERALANPAVRPGPLDLPQPPDGDATLTRGSELINDGGFENGAGPWSAAGKTAGKESGPDESQHHGGMRSFRLVNSRDASGMEVAVCVWGWGRGGPTMILEAGKSYEFSAWVLARQGMPQLRASFPDGAATMEKSGESGFAAGSWQRLWMRFTMTRNAKPGYLAVWLQGPGDIWIDDLSLREVISPLFSLSARQFLVDGSDRGIPLRFSRTSGTNPMTVFVTLPGAKTAQAVAIDQEGEVEIPFDARTMPIGHYEVRAESTQGDGTACTATTTIERVRGPFDP